MSNKSNLDSEYKIPTISVVIGTYQHVSFIKQCVDSVLKQQTSFPIEIIIGEDESTDGTREICIEYANKYPDKIRLFLRSRKDVIYINGRATGRNNFLENLKSVKGKYIALLDGDDYWTDPLKLQKQVDFLEKNSDYSICFHSIYELNAEGETKIPIINQIDKETTYTIEDLARGNFIHTPSVVFRNLLGGEFPSWFRESPAADYSLHMLNAKHGKIKAFPEVMAVYRLHGGGIWSTLKRRDMIINWIKVLDALMFEPFNSDIIANLQWQKDKCVNEMLELSASTNWQQFKLDVNEYVLNNPKLVCEWMTQRFPDMIDKYRSSVNNQTGSKWTNFFKPIKK